MISVEKPGSPSEILEHAGVKGMKWGVRKAVETTGNVGGAIKSLPSHTSLGRRMAVRKASMTPAQTAAKLTQTENRKRVAKRVAIGVAATSVVAASAFVAYKMNQNRLIKASEIKRAANVESQGDSILAILQAASGNAQDLR